MENHPRVIQSELMSNLGTFIVAWAQLEAHIDFIIDEIYSQFSGVEYSETKPVVGFKSKSKLNRKWGNKSEFAKSNFSWISDIMDETVALARPRNVIAHGIYTPPSKMKKIANIDMASFTQIKKDGSKETQIFPLDRLEHLILLTLYLGEIWRSLMLVIRIDGIAVKPKDLEIGLNNISKELDAFKIFVKDLAKL